MTISGPLRLPSLNALRAFEAVARKLSFARAAEELCVTKAAVAQQVRLLEEEIGVALVERDGRGLRLTEAGAAGAAMLGEGFSMLARAARTMREAKGRAFLVVNCATSLAATWLVGRIGKFKAKHPEFDVVIDVNPGGDSLDRPDIDAWIRWGNGDFPGYVGARLFKDEVFPVCAPKLINGEPGLRTPADLARLTLLHLEWNPAYMNWPTWADWLKAAGADGVDATRGVFFNQMAMAIVAAEQGQGVALASSGTAADALAAGRLIAPFALSMRSASGYFFLSRVGDAEAPRIRSLREFLVAEAALSLA